MSEEKHPLVVEVIDPAGVPSVHHFTDESMSIGRGLENDLTLPSLSLSRNHARLDRKPGGSVSITDLESKNGVYINGGRITPGLPQEITPVDKLEICGFKLRVGPPRRSTQRITPGLEMRDVSSNVAHSMTIDVLAAPEIRSTLIGTGQRSATAPPQDIPIADILSAAIDLMATNDLDQVRHGVLDFINRIVGYDAGYLLSWDEKAGFWEVDAFRHPSLTGQKPIISRSIVRDAVRDGRPVLLIDSEADDRYEGTQSIIGMGVRSAIATPLVADDGTVLSVIYVIRLGTGSRFSPADGRVLAYVAAVAALRFQNARLTEEALRSRFLEGELSVAARIQQDLLPEALPRISGYEVHGIYTPCSITSGDFYDFLRLEDGRLALALGDVSGKGVGAAMLMFSVVTVLRTIFMDLDEGRPFSGLLNRANCTLASTMAPGRFATAMVGLLDPLTGMLRYSNAGQCGILMRADGTWERLEAHGMPLGLFDTAIYEEDVVELQPGDLILLYTDGVSEARASDRTFFGEQRVISLLREHLDQNAETTSRALEDALTEFSTGEPRADDTTFVLIRRLADQ